MFGLHKFVLQFVDLSEQIRCQNMVELFTWMSKIVTGTGNFVAQSGELFETYMGEHLHFNGDESETYKELM